MTRTYFQIGTAETRGVVGSRAAKATSLEDALAECIDYSCARHVKSAWLRTITDGKMSDVLATFIKGVQQ